jgi:hypothetical protein
MFVKNYNMLNGKKIHCFNKLTNGYCVGGDLSVVINPVEVDSNGIAKDQRQTATIVNSNGTKTPENAIIPVDPWGIANFFCIS